MFVIFLGGGSYLCFSSRARGFLRQGGAIAMESWKDLFVPAASGTLVSEVDLALPGSVSSSGNIASRISSTEVFASRRKANANSGSSSRLVASSVPAIADAIEKGGQAVVENPPGDANSSSPQAIFSAPADISKISTTDVSSSDTTIDHNGNDFSGAMSARAGNCVFPVFAPATISHRVILNEIAWMGSPVAAGESADHAANREWMELKNISGDGIPLDGWQIMDAAGKIKISFGSGDELLPNTLYLLSRNGELVNGLSDDKAYTGVLSNDGNRLVVLDADCGVSDFIDASSKWPGGSNSTKQTLERAKNLSWQTSMAAGGTPRAENSAGAAVVAVASGAVTKYDVDLAISGDGGGKVMIKPDSMVCKISCVQKYAAGTTVTLAASPSSGTTFVGWSGGCSGTATCSFVVGGMVSVTAIFRLNIDASLMADNDAQNSVASDTATTDADANVLIATDTADVADQALSAASSSMSLSQTVAVDHLVVAEIQIAGAAASDDFVKIYNPTSVAVDIGGWKLRKKSSTGSDASLREFPAGSMIAPGAQFIWASSGAGFAQSIGADASSTETLSASNSVALFDGNGVRIDAVAWGAGTNQYVEGSPYPEDPIANQVLRRKFAGGMVVDTDNNSNDFTL
jgi:hypothetical protein